MSKNLQKALIGLFIVAFLVRIWRLDGMPPAIHPDEMAGLVGVLDELQGRAPLRPFFDYRIMYLPLTGIGEYLSSLLFGNNAWAYRFPSVLYGLVTIACTIGLTYRLTKEYLSAIFAGLVAAILPWEITVSRLGWENATMLPYLLGGLWALRAGLDDAKLRLIVLGCALLGIDAYSYRAALPDALALGITLVAIDLRAARRSWRAIVFGIVALAAIVSPLVLAVVGDPRFFWRDAFISTFRDGITPATLAMFARNYLAHFDLFALFFRGDGTPEHGPAFGVLYLWMLPFMLLGLAASPRRYGWCVASFLLFWLAIYPIGGAVTNDGVPHFLRTLVGAPLATILAGIGLAVARDAVRRVRFGIPAAVALATLAGLAFLQFCRAYFVGYEVAAANAFQYENRALFTAVRRYGASVKRICFQGLDDMNARTLFSYYLSDMRADVRERVDEPCVDSHSLLAVADESYAPEDARLVATAQTYDGTVKYYIFLTK